MTTASIHEAKTHLSKLIQKALAGEEVIIAGDHLERGVDAQRGETVVRRLRLR